MPHYSVIRYEPDIFTGERINIGNPRHAAELRL